MNEIRVGQVWLEKVTRTPLCVLSVNAQVKAVFVCGLGPGHQVFSFDDLRKNADLSIGWGRSSLFEGPTNYA